MNEVQVETAEQGPKRLHDSAKYKRWAALLAKFISIQVVVQLISMLSGFVVVHTLTRRQYAYFTLATTMQAVLLTLADVGIGNALYALSGKIWHDFRRFGEVVKTGLETRKLLAWAAVVLTIPALVLLLKRQKADWPTIAALTAFVLLGSWFRLTNDVYTIVVNIRGQIDRLQKLDLITAIIRIAALTTACFAFRMSISAVAINSLAIGFQSRFLGRWAAEGADLKAKANAEDRKSIYAVIKQQAPGTIYYAYQGQLSVFLISIYGSLKAVAEIGALSRFATVSAVIGMVMTRIVLPKFVKCQDKTQVFRMLVQIVSMFSLIGIVCVAIAYFFPHPFVWLLGRQYAFAEHDFVWVVLGSNLYLFVIGCSSPLQARAWTTNTWTAIPLTLAGQALMWHFVDLKTVKGVILITTVPQLSFIIPYYLAGRRGLNSMTATELPSNITSDSSAN